MLKILAIATMATALSSAAFATEAFIGQVGDRHSAQNIQLDQSHLSTSNAIIYQEGSVGGSNGHDALQVQQGDNNYAYTFQDSTYFDHIGLTWQDGHDNSAVTVQVTGVTETGVCNEGGTPNCPAQPDARFKSRIIQNGNYNVAVNWQSDTGGGQDYILSPTTPSLNLQGGNSPVNGNGVNAYPNNFGNFPAHFN